MTIWSIITALLVLVPATGAENAKTVRQVAIIGAGAAGSSAAYHLQAFAQNAGVAVNITIFEKTGRIGGRTLTIDPFGNSSQRVELGASIFIKKNKIMYDAMAEFDLSPRNPDEDADPTMGIWDGDEFVFTMNDNHSFWWTVARICWKYGIMAPRRTQQLMESTIAKFLRLYEEPYFPFRSLTQRTYELELVEVTGVTGEQLLAKNNIGASYAHDIVQASTRVNYASNLAFIHGLDAMVSMAPEGAMAVKGGNWQIFHNMVEASKAAALLNTSVVSVGLASDDEDASSRAKYALRTKPESSTLRVDEEYPVLFDDVVLANPFQFSKIGASDGVIQYPIDEIPYVQLHVTIFASPFRYAAGFFGMEDANAVPGTILTTLGKDDEPTSGPQGVGKSGFFSISTLRKVVNPKTQKQEYLYKIFSPEKITSDFLSRLFGVDVPDTIVSDKDSTTVVPPISWYYPHVFYSYPKALPRVTFQDPIIGPGLYYTSGMESFISTMETNALMGKNVARLIVDDILGLSTGGDVNPEARLDAGGSQKVMCDRGRNLEVPKTRPTESVYQDL